MRSRRDILKNPFIKAVADALFPARCLVCGSFIHNKAELHGYAGEKEKTVSHQFHVRSENCFSKRMSPFLCPTCRKGFVPVESPVCDRCGVMFKSRTGKDHLCGECITSPKKFRLARAFGVYDHAVMSVIHCLKYKGKIQLARPLGRLLFSVFIRAWRLNRIDLIVPVPLYPKKQRMRGFNQSFLLVRDWPDWAALNPEATPIRLEKTVLLRNRWTEPQTGLGRKQRLSNIKNAFSVEKPLKVKNKNILLVDDVYTTGATVNECAKVLLRAGTSRVDVLTLARAM